MTTTIDGQKIRNYILSCIDLSGYEKYTGVQLSEKARVQAVYDIFKNEYLYPENLKRYGSEQKTFENWLMGLPSCFNIDFENHKILELTESFGYTPKTERQRQAVLDQWWGRIYMQVRKILTAKARKLKIKTIDIKALEWFDKVNGNSYFAGSATVNYGLKNERTVTMCFQYGYGDHYKSMAFAELEQAGIIVDREHYQNGSGEGIWQYCDRHKIILRTEKYENCKKRELMQFTAKS
jgi:hypothetical protein